MKWIKDFQLFLFDFDGVLVDTEPLHYEAYAKVCQKRGIPWTRSFEQYCVEAHGEAQGIKKAFLRDHPECFEHEPAWEAFAAEKKEIYAGFLKRDTLQLLPGVAQLLQALDQSGLVRCVVTNSSFEDVEEIKKSLPILKSIPHWITRKDYTHPKPSPEGYQKAIALYGFPACRAIGFEDTYKGFKALSQTSAHPVLICPSSRSHVSACLALGGEHVESFEEMLTKDLFLT